jgi:hypothetical protein
LYLIDVKLAYKFISYLLKNSETTRHILLWPKIMPNVIFARSKKTSIEKKLILHPFNPSFDLEFRSFGAG